MIKKLFFRPVLVAAAVLTATLGARAADVAPYKAAVGGLTAYIGTMPAQIVSGYPAGHPEQSMHGGAPQGRHEYHLVVAIFDAAGGARISDAMVTATISGVGLSGSQEKLEPMNIANTITYGGFVDLPGPDLYTIRLTIQRPRLRQPVVMDFKYDHRR